MAWFVKYYKHAECRTIWTDEWSCACNDHCPKCDAEIEPYEWEDLSILIEEVFAGKWTVKVSPPSASDSPSYQEHLFSTRHAAEVFAAEAREKLLVLDSSAM